MHDQTTSIQIQNQQLYEWSTSDLGEIDPARWIVNESKTNRTTKQAPAQPCFNAEKESNKLGSEDPFRKFAEIFRFGNNEAVIMLCEDLQSASLATEVALQDKENIPLSQLINAIASKYTSCTLHNDSSVLVKISRERDEDDVLCSTLTNFPPPERDQV